MGSVLRRLGAALRRVASGLVDAEDVEALAVLGVRWLLVGGGVIWAAYAAGTAVRVFCDASLRCAGG